MAKIAVPRIKNGLGKTLSVPSQSQQEQIQQLAYQFFVDRGYEHGHDAEDWARAEAIIKRKKS